MEKETIALIIGGGPAGLTAAYELATRTGIKPVVLEKSDTLGGISRTVEYKGNRMDIGGHRFFFQIRQGDGMVVEDPSHTGSEGRINLDHIP